MSQSSLHGASSGRLPMMIPARYFTSYSKESTETCTDGAECVPLTRFQKRNAFLRKRHLDRDHIIRAQHYDIRISAVRATETVRDAVRRHGMISEEARSWGGTAACSALYSSFLRGDERIKVETSTMSNTTVDEDALTMDNRMYCESFAVGEIRGFAHFNQLKFLKHFMLFPREPKDTENVRLQAGEGIMRISKILYGYHAPYETMVQSSGKVHEDWNTFFEQSEQIPSYVHMTSKIHDTPFDRVVGFDGNPVTPEIDTAQSYLNIPQEDVEFQSAVLIQVLGGESHPEHKIRILSTVPIPRLVEETDDAYVKRVQLLELQERVKTLDTQEIVTKYGLAVYVATLLGEEPEALTFRNDNQENLDKDIDFEVLDRTLIASAMREKYINKQAEAQATMSVESVINGALGAKPTLPAYKYEFQYRPIAFFCRCAQTPVATKLQQLPTDLLEDLEKDGGAEFNCDMCNTPQVVPLENIQSVLQERKTLETTIETNTTTQ